MRGSPLSSHRGRYLLGGALLAGSPVAFCLRAWVGESPFAGDPTSSLWIRAAVGAGALSAGLLLPSLPRAAFACALFGLLGSLGLSLHVLVESPAGTLATLLPAILLVDAIWPRSPSRTRSLLRWRDRLALTSRGACIASVTLWGAAAVTGFDADLATEIVPVAVSVGLAGLLLVAWFLAGSAHHRSRALALGSIAVIAGLLVALAWGDAATVLSASTLVPAAAAVLLPRPRWRSDPDTSSVWQPITEQPERLLVVTFVILSAIGTAVLALPVSSSSGEGLKLGDAAFTAVSAACVTGLVVVDTAATFSATGEAFVLALIQLGGLGIMTFSTLILVGLRRRVSVRHEIAIAGLLSEEDRGRIFLAARRVLVFTLLLETMGTLVLLAVFTAHGEAPGSAAWRATFTAVSAFCNAGFSLQADSLISYQTNPWVLHTVAALIILGGLSPLVVLGTLRHARNRSRGSRLPVETRLVLWMTAALLVGGFVHFLFAEWNASLGGLSFVDRLHNAWFQSVTLRTAGFNSVSYERIEPATVAIMTLLMFIGGSPGGTAGGMKTTTATVLLLAAVTAVRGSERLEVFGRQIPHRTIYRAAAIATAGVASLFFAFLALSLTQDLPPIPLVFESASALGTVGLSLDLTPRLDGIGRTIIMACMLAGRVGPLTVFAFLSQRERRAAWQLPEEEISVG